MIVKIILLYFKCLLGDFTMPGSTTHSDLALGTKYLDLALIKKLNPHWHHATFQSHTSTFVYIPGERLKICCAQNTDAVPLSILPRMVINDQVLRKPMVHPSYPPPPLCTRWLSISNVKMSKYVIHIAYLNSTCVCTDKIFLDSVEKYPCYFKKQLLLIQWRWLHSPFNPTPQALLFTGYVIMLDFFCKF